MPTTSKGYPYPAPSDPADGPAAFQALADAVNSTAISSGDTAGGDLTGTYPNPTIASNAVGTSEIADGAVTSAKIADGTIVNADISNSAAIAVSKLAASAVTINGTSVGLGASGTITAAPSGSAGGALTGTYPNPTLANNSVGTAQIANGAVTGAKIAQASATTGQALVWSGTTWQPGDVAANFQIDGGVPDSVYGGTTPIDGGTP